MWVLKFTNWHKTCVIRPLCVEHNVTDLVYLINQWKTNEMWYYTELHILQGSAEGKRAFIEDMKQDSTTERVERYGDNIITLNARPVAKEFYSALFDDRIIQTRPVVQRSDGYEDWELACWTKEPLMEVLNIPEFDITIKSIQEEPLKEVFLPHIHPTLSDKQKEAVQLAVKEGYYDFPRSTDLKSLAKHMRISRPTYQEHLRKAERKLLPFLVENMED